jgi:plasmid stability protein
MVVRKMEDEVKARRHGCSTEEEVREILRDAFKEEGALSKPLGTRLRECFAGIGLDDDLLELRGEVARPATYRPAVMPRRGRAGRA